jgi:GT2 family glycosyltransferase
MLDDAVASVLAGVLVPDEIVVVDQSREPHAALIANGGAPVRYVYSPTRGLCRARNLAVREARGDLLAFIDDDATADPGWLAALVDAAGAEDERLVAGGQVVPASPERAGAFVASEYVDHRSAVYQGRIDRDPLGGGNMAAYRSAFATVGLFDERLGAGARYPAADDNDIGLRLLEAGYRIVYVPEATIYHRAWRRRWSYPALRWRYGRGKGGFYAKHRALGDGHIRRRLRRDVGHRLRRLPLLALRQPRRAVGDVAYVAGVVAGYGSWRMTEPE